MTILCFEGPSAVGKTTVAQAFGSARGVHVVADVHALFGPTQSGKDGYLERQVERWRIAKDAATSGLPAVLDGDPFQPLWYNWAYDFNGWQPLDEIETFYRDKFLTGAIEWPDLYVVFSAPIETLQRQKDADSMRQRRHFEQHLCFIEPQRRYFHAMQQLAPERVLFLEVGDIDETVRRVAGAADAAKRSTEGLQLFDALILWLRETRPRD